MLRITLVSYLNTKPFVEGLSREFGQGEILLDLRPPSGCAEAFRKGECDLALLPAGALPDFRDAEVVSHYCIGTKGKVDSVFLFSNDPVSSVDKVILDPDSRTSNLLAKIIFREGWKKDVQFQAGADRNFQHMPAGTARVAIGDVAYSFRTAFPYVYDLSQEWKRMTGLPFVFAVWVAKQGRLNLDYQNRLDRAFAAGVARVGEVAKKYAIEFGYSFDEAEKYLGESLDFHFDSAKADALKLFLTFAADQSLSR